MSTAFAPLAQVVGQGIGHASLPLVAIGHPVGDRDAAAVRQKGVDAAQECVRLLTTSAERLTAEFEDKEYPLPESVMPR